MTEPLLVQREIHIAAPPATVFALQGEWIEAKSDFHRIGKELAFANCYIRVGDRVIGRANGQYKVAPER